jgi:hypothetical protein
MSKILITKDPHLVLEDGGILVIGLIKRLFIIEKEMCLRNQTKNYDMRETNYHNLQNRIVNWIILRAKLKIKNLRHNTKTFNLNKRKELIIYNRNLMISTS